MEIDSGSYIYDDLMAKTYFAKGSLDRRKQFFSYSSAKENYKNYLEEKVKSPIRARLAMQKVYNREGVFYPEDYARNIDIIEKSSDIEPLVKKVKDAELIYPRTSLLRKIFIEKNIVQLDTVTPKLSFLKKMLLKMSFYF